MFFNHGHSNDQNIYFFHNYLAQIAEKMQKFNILQQLQKFCSNWKVLQKLQNFFNITLQKTKTSVD